MSKRLMLFQHFAMAATSWVLLKYFREVWLSAAERFVSQEAIDLHFMTVLDMQTKISQKKSLMELKLNYFSNSTRNYTAARRPTESPHDQHAYSNCHLTGLALEDLDILNQKV